MESGKDVGGWINSSISEDGSVFEAGPRSLRAVLNDSIYNLMKLVGKLSNIDIQSNQNYILSEMWIEYLYD